MASPAVSPLSSPAAESTIPPETASSLWPADLSRWYLPEDDDDVGISYQTLLVLRALLSAMEQWVKEEGKEWLVGSEQDMLLREDDQRVGVRPDAYLLPCIPEDLTFERWPAYQEGTPIPVLAVEFVSPSNWKKDYEEAPEKYTALGVEELVLVDLLAARGESRAKGAEVLQVYRREGGGKLERVYAGPGPARSEVMGVWWREEGGAVVLTRDREGKERLPTKEEAEEGKKRAAEERAKEAWKARQVAEKEKRTAEEKAQKAVQVQQAAEAKAEEAEKKAKAEAQARQQAEAKAKEAENKAKAEAEARQQADAKAKEAAKAQQAAEAKAKETAQAQQAAENKAKEAENKAKAEAQARQQAENEALAEAREAILDLCDLLAIAPTAEQKAQLQTLDLAGLRLLRSSLKLHKRWPG